jgi:uncharacterized protein DUF6335
MGTRRPRSADRVPVPLRRPAVEENGRRPERSPTSVAAEALRTGIIPMVPPRRRGGLEIPHEDETIRVGDPDDRSLANAYGGEDTPGGSSSTPDQSVVDEIGRVYGLQEEDAGDLRSAAEILAGRDRHRSELKPPRRTP